LKISSVSFRNNVQRGPLLITHWGLSGPAVLKLSAWGARTLAENNYIAQLSIDWLPSIHIEEIRSILTDTKHTWKTKQVTTTCPFRDKNGRQFLAKELWRNIVVHTLKTEDNAAIKKMWKDISKAQIAALSTALKSSIFEIRGKGIFKEEFVTCGGIGRKHVHFETMESKWIPGLYFAGEILDIDGLTGGFNCEYISISFPNKKCNYVSSTSCLDNGLYMWSQYRKEIGNASPSNVRRHRWQSIYWPKIGERER